MFYVLVRKRNTAINRVFSFCFVLAFIFNLTIPAGVHAQVAAKPTLGLPLPGTMLAPTESYVPPMMTGVVINPNDPLEFEFMINHGDTDLNGEAFQKESEKLIKYFLATLTIPEEKLWVNLSPYEKDQMISAIFGETEMGRDLLGQDYILKQLSASLMYPKEELGKKFWDRVHAKAAELFESEDVPVSTFNKVWIVPQKANIYENETGAFIVDSHLKVMLEEDYLALQKNMAGEGATQGEVLPDDAKEISKVTTDVIREIMIPEIEKEVNEGTTFANLRQIYSSMILAAWYKKNLKESFLGQVYIDQSKIEGVDLDDPTVKEQIYQQYLTAFQKGVYDYMERNFDPATNEVVVQKYFSGGMEFTAIQATTQPKPMEALDSNELALAAPPLLMSSFTTKDEKDKFTLKLKSLPASAQAGIRKISQAIASNTAAVKVSLAPKTSIDALQRNIEAALSSTSGSSPIEVDRITADSLDFSRTESNRMGSALRALTTNEKFPAAITNQRTAVAEGVTSGLTAQGVVFTPAEITDAVREIQMAVAQNPGINVLQAKQVLISAGFNEDIAGPTAEFAFNEIQIPDVMSGQRTAVVQGVANELEVKEITFDRLEAESAAAQVQRMMVEEPAMEVPQAKQALLDAGFNEDIAGPTVDLAFGARSIDAQSMRAQNNRLNNFVRDVETVVNFGGGGISISPVDQSALVESKPIIGEAAQVALLVNTGEMVPNQISPQLISQVVSVQEELIGSYDREASVDQRMSTFYKIQATTNLLAELKGQDPNVPRFGLSNNEREFFASGQISDEDARSTFQALNQQLNTLLTVEKSVGDSGYQGALRLNTAKVTGDIKIVNDAAKRAHEAATIAQTANNPRELQEFVAAATSITDFSGAAEALNQSPAVFVLDLESGGDTVRQVTPSEAINMFRETQAPVMVTPQNNTLLITSNQPRESLTSTQASFLSNLRPVQARSLNVTNTVARLQRGSKPEELGGIDLNPSILDMQIKRDGNGVTLPIAQQPEDVMNIQGFVPVITDVSPAAGAPAILGSSDSSS